MSETRPRTNKLDGTALATIVPRLELSAAAASRLASEEPPSAGEGLPSAAVEKLAAAGFLIEAARLCAHALPRREAVWWAARCAAATAPEGLSDADREACALAESWVRRPADETRRAAMAKAELAGFTTPEAWAAVAAFWSGDSMSPADQPKVPPAPHLAGTAVAGAIILASVRAHPERQADRLRRFLAGAQDIAAGGAGTIEKEIA